MKCEEHPRVKEILSINRMVYPSPQKGKIAYQVEGNYLRGLAHFVDEFLKDGYTICEVGCYMGLSSELFALFSKKIYCIDTWGKDIPEYVEGKFDERLRPYSNVVKIKKESTVASKEFSDNYLDLIYIDGDHSETGFRNDMIHWTPKVKSSGVISGHDYHMVYSWLQDYVDLNLVKVFKDGSWGYYKNQI